MVAAGTPLKTPGAASTRWKSPGGLPVRGDALAFAGYSTLPCAGEGRGVYLVACHSGRLALLVVVPFFYA